MKMQKDGDLLLMKLALEHRRTLSGGDEKESNLDGEK